MGSGKPPQKKEPLEQAASFLIMSQWKLQFSRVRISGLKPSTLKQVLSLRSAKNLCKVWDSSSQAP